MDTGLPQVPSTGGVAGLIHRYGGPANEHAARHGAAGRGRPRGRSRETRREGASSAPTWRTDMLSSHRPSGPQEQLDWLNALNTFEDRMQAVERV